MQCKFHVGQRVVCIKKGEWQYHRSPTGLAAHPRPGYGDVVTVSEIDIRASCGRPFLELVEFGKPYLYLAACFEPVKTTDISIFTQMLAPKPKVKEDA